MARVLHGILISLHHGFKYSEGYSNRTGAGVLHFSTIHFLNAHTSLQPRLTKRTLQKEWNSCAHLTPLEHDPVQTLFYYHENAIVTQKVNALFSHTTLLNLYVDQYQQR